MKIVKSISIEDDLATEIMLKAKKEGMGFSEYVERKCKNQENEEMTFNLLNNKLILLNNKLLLNYNLLQIFLNKENEQLTEELRINEEKQKKLQTERLERIKALESAITDPKLRTKLIKIAKKKDISEAFSEYQTLKKSRNIDISFTELKKCVDFMVLEGKK